MATKNVVHRSNVFIALPTLIYLSLAWRRSGRPNVSIDVMLIAIPVMYGVALALGEEYNLPPWASGSLLGLVLSTIGRNAGLPETLFGFETRASWQVTPIAIVLYAIIFEKYHPMI